MSAVPFTIDGMPPGWTVEYYDGPIREIVAEHPRYASCYVGVRHYVTEEHRERLRKEAWLRHPQITTIFLDVDEVLADWVGATLRLLGYDPAEVIARWNACDPRPWDLFSVIDHTPSEGWRAIDAAGAEFWATLRMFTWSAELYETCCAFAPTVLLTSPSLHPSSHAGKAQWMQHVFGRNFRDYLIGSVKHRCAHAGALLIDDSPKNCEAFVQAGGHAILFPGVGNDLHHVASSERVAYVREQLKGYRACQAQ